MHCCRAFRTRATAVLVGSLTLLMTGARADVPQYQVQPIVKVGDTVGSVRLAGAPNVFAIAGLNDQGQFAFTSFLAGVPQGAALIQYDNGRFIPVLVAGGQGPLGPWPRGTLFYEPTQMNAQGNIVLGVVNVIGSSLTDLGTFLRDYSAQKLTPIAQKGMKITGNLVLESGTDFSPAINNRNEIVFPAQVQNSAGQPRDGIFLRSRDGTLQPLVLPDLELPSRRRVGYADQPSVNDAGQVAFQVLERGQTEPHWSGYLWDQGTISSIAIAGMDAPDGGQLMGITGVWTNNHDRNVLVIATKQDGGPSSLYRWSMGKLAPVAVPGQSMPGGGVLKDIPLGYIGVSAANSAGQHLFCAQLQDGASAAYRLDADGSLALVIKSGMATDQGTVTQVGARITGQVVEGGLGAGLNNQGQVLLSLRIAGGPDTLALLTPSPAQSPCGNR